MASEPGAREAAASLQKVPDKKSSQHSLLKERRQGLAVNDLLIPRPSVPNSRLGGRTSTLTSDTNGHKRAQQSQHDEEEGILTDEELRGWAKAHGVERGKGDGAHRMGSPTTNSMPSFKAWPMAEESPELKVKRQLSGSLRLLRTISRRTPMPELQRRGSGSTPLVSPEKPAEALFLEEEGQVPGGGGKNADAFPVDEGLLAEGARRISVMRRVQSMTWIHKPEATASKIEKMLLKRAVMAHFRQEPPAAGGSFKVPQTAPASEWAGQVVQDNARTPPYPMSGPVRLVNARSEDSLLQLLHSKAGSWKVKVQQGKLSSTPEVSPGSERPPVQDSPLVRVTQDAEDTTSDVGGSLSAPLAEPPSEDAVSEGCPRTESGRFIVTDTKRKLLEVAPSGIEESISQEGSEVFDSSIANSHKPMNLQPPEKRLNSIDLTKLFLGEKIAAGSFGRIYRGEYKKREVAVKMLRATTTQEAGDEMELQFVNEVQMLSRLDHPNIVQFVGAYCKPPVRAIVMEYMRGGSVREWLRLREGQPILSLQLIDMATDIANGMAYLHSLGIVHRDLKSENLLFDSDGTIKVADFGEAYFLGSNGCCQGEIGTYRWMAPEVLAGKPYNHKVDVYSFGLVLWELLTLRIPFEGLSGVQAAYAVVAKNLRPSIPKECPVGIEQLMTSCWATNPKHRPDFTEVVEALKWIADDVAQDGGSPYAWSSRGKRRYYCC